MCIVVLRLCRSPALSNLLVLMGVISFKIRFVVWWSLLVLTCFVNLITICLVLVRREVLSRGVNLLSICLTVCDRFEAICLVAVVRVNLGRDVSLCLVCMVVPVLCCDNILFAFSYEVNGAFVVCLVVFVVLVLFISIVTNVFNCLRVCCVLCIYDN